MREGGRGPFFPRFSLLASVLLVFSNPVAVNRCLCRQQNPSPQVREEEEEEEEEEGFLWLVENWSFRCVAQRVSLSR